MHYQPNDATGPAQCSGQPIKLGIIVIDPTGGEGKGC